MLWRSFFNSTLEEKLPITINTLLRVLFFLRYRRPFRPGIQVLLNTHAIFSMLFVDQETNTHRQRSSHE